MGVCLAFILLLTFTVPSSSLYARKTELESVMKMLQTILEKLSSFDVLQYSLKVTQTDQTIKNLEVKLAEFLASKTPDCHCTTKSAALTDSNYKSLNTIMYKVVKKLDNYGAKLLTSHSVLSEKINELESLVQSGFTKVLIPLQPIGDLKTFLEDIEASLKKKIKEEVEVVLDGLNYFEDKIQSADVALETFQEFRSSVQERFNNDTRAKCSNDKNSKSLKSFINKAIENIEILSVNQKTLLEKMNELPFNSCQTIQDTLQVLKEGKNTTCSLIDDAVEDVKQWRKDLGLCENFSGLKFCDSADNFVSSMKLLQQDIKNTSDIKAIENLVWSYCLGNEI